MSDDQKVKVDEKSIKEAFSEMKHISTAKSHGFTYSFDSTNSDIKGRMLRSKEQLEKALEEFQKAIDINPEWVEPREFKAQCLMELQRYTDAVNECDEALKLQPHKESKERILEIRKSASESKELAAAGKGVEL